MKLFSEFKKSITLRIYLFYSLAVIAAVGIMGLFISSGMSKILLSHSIGYNRQQLASVESGYMNQISHIKSIAERANYVKTGVTTTVYDSIKLMLNNKSVYKSAEEYDEYIANALTVYTFFNLVENVSQTQAPIFFITGTEQDQGILTVNRPVVNLEKPEYAKLISDKMFTVDNSELNMHNCIPNIKMAKADGEYENYYILFEYIRDKYNPAKLAGSFVLGYDSKNLIRYIENFSSPLMGVAYVLYSDGTEIFDSEDNTCGDVYKYFDLIKSNDIGFFEEDGKVVNFIHNEMYDFYVVGEMNKSVLYRDINRNNFLLFLLVSVCSVIVIFITTRLFKTYSVNISELKSQKAQLQQRKAEIKALQFQINPHFLYNTLETIRMKALSFSDYDTAEMIKLLANLFRNRVKSDMAVAVSDEIKYYNSLLKLYSIKCNNEVETVVDVADEIIGYGILKDLIQPVLENVFVHAFSDSNGYEGCRISLKGRRFGDDLVFEIENNSAGMSGEVLKKVLDNLERESEEGLQSVGLYSIHHRIKLVYGSGYGLSIISNKETGTKVTIKIAALSIDELIEKTKETMT